MVYKVILTGYRIREKLLSLLIWLWDVVFTQIDIFQIRIWNMMRCSLTKLKSGKVEFEKRELQKDGIDSWD